MKIREKPLRQGMTQKVLISINECARTAMLDAIEKGISDCVIEDAGRSDMLELQDRSSSAAGRRMLAEGRFEQIPGGGKMGKGAVGTDGRAELFQLSGIKRAKRIAGHCQVGCMAALLCAGNEPKIRKLFQVAVNAAAADRGNSFRQRLVDGSQDVACNGVLVKRGFRMLQGREQREEVKGLFSRDCVELIGSCEIIERSLVGISLQAVDFLMTAARDMEAILWEEEAYARPMLIIGAGRQMQLFSHEYFMITTVG